MAIKNDLSFVIDSQLSLYEHQSTYSPNLPPPRFIIFYNGEEAQPDRRILKLADLYEVEEEEHKLELEAVMLNINAGHNPELMKACRTLADYARYTACIRRHAAEMPIEEAVERTITECIREGILEEFLRKYRAEAKRMSIYEYDQARHIRQEREEARKEEKKNIAVNLARMGMTAEQIAKAVEEESAVVEKWLTERS